MDKPSHTLSNCNHFTAVSPSPRLVRSRSGSGSAATAITTPERSSQRFSSSERFGITSIQRSKSTSRTRTTTNNEGNNPTLTTSISNKQTSTRVHQEKKNKDESFGKSLQRGVSPIIIVTLELQRELHRHLRMDAFAGRWSLGSPIWPQQPAKAPMRSKSNVGGSVNKVLKYFKQKKVSPMQEEEYHRFRVLHNRLVQWMFVNARAQVAMANVKSMAQIQLFAVWVRIVKLRKIRIGKSVEVRKVDTKSISEALNSAITVMENMEPLITKYHTKENEKSIGVHLIQTMESNTTNYLCTTA
ncbi:hypothetical protein ACSQ67_009676 [Phaseolus vulgaris]